jgi:vitamin B12 transporter
MLRLGISLVCGLLPFLCLAQVDTIVSLDSVVIIAQPLRNDDPGSQVSLWKRSDHKGELPGSLAGLMSMHNFAFVRSYGPGSLATSSVRGGNAGQTMVLWNGLPLQSPMLGQLDFSLLPLSFADQISLKAGGSTALWGSGAVAGVIALDNHFDQQGRVSLQSTLGSFGIWDQQLQVHLGTLRLQSDTRLLYKTARNDFPYKVGSGPVRNLENAETEQKGLMQSFQYPLSDNSKLIFHYWHQQADRRIPPLLTQNTSKARQQDVVNRIMLTYRQHQLRSAFQLNAAYFAGQMSYQDPGSGSDSRNDFHTAIFDFNRDWFFSERIKASLGSTHTYSSAEADAYLTPASEYRGSLFAAVRSDFDRWDLMTVVRKEWVDDHSIPVTPSLSFRYRLSPVIWFKGKISRDYRMPTLNDRYWVPGGNLSLKPESGWSEELGLSMHNRKGALSWNYDIAVFNRLIRDWILWSRQEGHSFFSPANITRVWSRGIEQQLSISHHWNHQFNTVKLTLHHSLIKSTNQVGIANPRMDKGDQLIYTPKHQGNMLISLKIRDGGCFYQHAFTGNYTAINQKLPGYQVSDIGLFQKISMYKEKVELYFTINNIWNQEYQVVENRPMPGRYFTGGLKTDLGT